MTHERGCGALAEARQAPAGKAASMAAWLARGTVPSRLEPRPRGQHPTSCREGRRVLQHAGRRPGGTAEHPRQAPHALPCPCSLVDRDAGGHGNALLNLLALELLAHAPAGTAGQARRDEHGQDAAERRHDGTGSAAPLACQAAPRCMHRRTAERWSRVAAGERGLACWHTEGPVWPLRGRNAVAEPHCKLWRRCATQPPGVARPARTRP